MKVLAIILLAFVAYATAAEHVPNPLADRSLSSAAVDAIEGMRDQMPCGFPILGIPPLAPFKLEHREINIDTPTLQLQGVLNNFRLNGLNDFEIADMRINAITSKVNFRFIFNNINVDTSYDLRLMLKKAGFTINMIGAGPAKFAIKDMVVTGIMKYSLGVLSGKLKLKTLDIRTHIGDVESEIEGVLGDGSVNHKMNEALAEAVELMVNENEDQIAGTIEAITMPMVNEVLDEMTLAQMISAIGNDGTEKEACIPPSD